MTSSDVVEMFCILAQNTGRSRNSTVGPNHDPTSCETITVKVFMDYGFGEPVKGEGQQDEDAEYPRGTEPPAPEMVEVEIVCIWGREIRLTGETFKAKGYYDKGWCWVEGLMSNGKRVEDERFEVILRRLIREGDWKGIDKRELEEDTMGSLSDYE